MAIIDRPTGMASASVPPDCYCYGCRDYHSVRLARGKPATDVTTRAGQPDVPPFGSLNLWPFLSGEDRSRIACTSSILNKYWQARRLPCIAMPRSAETWLSYGREAVQSGPATEKEQQVQWMIRIFERAVPGALGPDVKEFVSVLIKAGLTQIGRWRMAEPPHLREEAPHLREEAPQLREESPHQRQQRYLRVVRGVFDDIQANQ